MSACVLVFFLGWIWTASVSEGSCKPLRYLLGTNDLEIEVDAFFCGGKWVFNGNSVFSSLPTCCTHVLEDKIMLDNTK